MPNFPIVDGHVHLYDVGHLRYGWLKAHPEIDRPFLVPDYREASRGIDVEAIVFAEAAVDAPFSLREAEWLGRHAVAHGLIRGMIAAAPLENGRDIAGDLDELRRQPTFRAVRRVTQHESDPDYCLRPGFVEGVELLGERGVVCDICVFQHQLPAVVELARRCPGTQFVLDHIGKPDIRAGLLDPWRGRISDLAGLPNVVCKISGVVTEADHRNWSRDEIRPFVDHALESFGFRRVLFGSDWPVLTLASNFAEWVDTADRIVEGCSTEEKRGLFRDNATRVYRL